MTTDARTAAQNSAVAQLRAKGKKQKPSLLQLPGLVAISLYMILVAGITIISVANHVASPIYLVFPVFFIAGALGMLLLLRWAWALTLAAVALMSGSFLWGFSTQHSLRSLMQGLLNLAFFLYLVRADVREKLR